MPKNIQKEKRWKDDPPIALPGTIYDEKRKKRVNIILIDEGWLGKIRRRYEQGKYAQKRGIEVTIRHILLHEKAHSKGIIDEKKADTYAEKILIQLNTEKT